MKKDYINEAAWSKMLIFLKKEKSIYKSKEHKIKNFIEAIYWIGKEGARWRALPEKYGNWNSVFKRFNAWSKKNVWEKFFKFFQDPDVEFVMIDSTTIRAHQSATGYGKQSEQALGRNSGGLTTKIHALVDALGNPLKFIVTPGQKHDLIVAQSLLEETKNTYVLADRAYNDQKLKCFLEKNACIAVIPPKANFKTPVSYDKHLFKERYRIENFFLKIKNFRRVATRFEKSAQNFLSFVYFAGASIWLR